MSDLPEAASPTPGPGPDAERRATVFAIASAALTSGLYVAARATRDALFLSTLSATNLPPAIMTAAVLSIAASFGLSAWLARRPPLQVAPLAFGGSALLFSLAWLGLGGWPAVVAVGLYLHVTGLVPLVLSTFWSVANERFDPYTAKRLISRMAAAGALGGVGGGLGAERLAAAIGLPPLLLILAGLSLVCAVCVHRIGSAEATGEPPHADPTPTGLRSLARRPLLRQMGALMVMVAAVETLVEYALNVEAEARFPDAAELVRFFAIFYTGCGVLSFALQVALGNRLLQRLGLAAAVALLPISVGLAGSVAVVAGRFWGFVLARGAETVFSVSLFRAGFQLLYTPVPNEAKRPAKAWIDVASGSLGDILGAGLVIGLLALLTEVPSSWVVAIGVGGCGVSLLIVRRIHRSYVRQLTDSLRAGRLALRVEDALDATTAHTIAASHMSLDRGQLLDEIRAYRAERGDAAEAPAAATPHPAEPPAVDAAATELARRAAALADRDPRRVRAVLRGTWSESARRDAHRLAGLAIPLLGDPDLAADAEHFLAALSRRVVGPLVDAVLDPEETPTVRVRALSLLAKVPGARAFDGLMRAAEDPDFEIRFAAARAAARRRTGTSDETPDRSRVYALVLRELSVSDAEWTRQSRRPPSATGQDRSVLIRGRALERLSRSLEHVFTLLALVHDREVMASTLAGLTGGNRSLHGTAMEYLESILPPAVRRALWKRLQEPAPTPQAARSESSMADELLRTSVGLVIDRRELDGD
jgi:hypothetical protein